VENPRSHIAGFFLGLLCLYAILEIPCRIFGFPYNLFDVSGFISSRQELKDRIDFVQKNKMLQAVILGDSVLGPSALLEHHQPHARQHSLADNLKNILNAQKNGFVNLSADGMLPVDMENITDIALAKGVRDSAVLLNLRMFSKEFASPEKSSFFQFSDLNEKIVRASALFRFAEQLKGEWFIPNAQSYFQRELEGVSAKEQDDDLREAVLRQRVMPYFQVASWDFSSPQWRALRNMRDKITANNGRILFIFVPQNPDYVNDLGSFENIKSQIEKARSLLAPAGQNNNVTVQSFVDRFDPESFLDHCHLTEAGNRRFAEILAASFIKEFS
jgi:hypothetical protein